MELTFFIHIPEVGSLEETLKTMETKRSPILVRYDKAQLGLHQNAYEYEEGIPFFRSMF